MARMNDEGQWIILMGLIVSVSILFLAFVISQATTVGQTTSEAILESPKLEIQDLRNEIISIAKIKGPIWIYIYKSTLNKDIEELALYRQNAIIDFSVWYEYPDPDPSANYTQVIIHYNNGIIEYEEEHLIILKEGGS